LGNLATPKSVQKLQTALHAKAKAEAGYRFYALYDKISRDDILAHAYAQCRSNLSGLLMERFALLALMGSAASGLIRSSAAQALSYIRLGSCGPCRRAISIHLAFCCDSECRAEACSTSGSCILLLAAQQDPGDTCGFIGEGYNCPIEAAPGNKRFQPS